jgi:hypothetical protein
MTSIFDGKGEFSSRIFYVPPWVRLFALVIILTLLASSGLVLVWSINEPGLHNWTIAALATAELTGAAALALLFLFFVERGHRTRRLDTLCQVFFTEEMPAALKKMSYKNPEFATWQSGNQRFAPLETLVEIEIAYASGSYAVDYLVQSRGVLLWMSVEANVKRVSVVYSIEKIDNRMPKELFDEFKDTWDGAKNAGYHLGLARSFIRDCSDLPPRLGWKDAVSMPLHVNKDNNFLHNEVERHYVAQDISIMTRSFIAEGIDSGLLRPKTSPLASAN